MKVVYYFKKWTDAIYNKTEIGDFQFWFWSNMVLGKGDENLKFSFSPILGPINWLKKHLKWKKFIVLIPKGDPETKFKVGFYSEDWGICKIAPMKGRKISDGPFAMRMGPEDYYFFVVGDDLIELEIAGYIRKDLWLY